MRKFLMIVFMTIALIAQIKGQVTIGALIEPGGGALLDLKETNGDNANSTRGLLLPRVRLHAMNELRIGVNNEVDIIDEQDKLNHTGLTVYHISTTSDACTLMPTGLYVWKGEEWNKLLPRTDISQIPDFEDRFIGANSYIVKTSSEVKIPIERGFQVWKHFQAPVGGAQPTKGKVLNLADVNNLRGSLSTELIWQTNNNVLTTNPLSIEGNSTITTEADETGSYLVVKTGVTEGNALVAVKIGEKFCGNGISGLPMRELNMILMLTKVV